jgi:hypothetical protein
MKIAKPDIQLYHSIFLDGSSSLFSNIDISSNMSFLNQTLFFVTSLGTLPLVQTISDRGVGYIVKTQAQALEILDAEEAHPFAIAVGTGRGSVEESAAQKEVGESGERAWRQSKPGSLIPRCRSAVVDTRKHFLTDSAIVSNHHLLIKNRLKPGPPVRDFYLGRGTG